MTGEQPEAEAAPPAPPKPNKVSPPIPRVVRGSAAVPIRKYPVIPIPPVTAAEAVVISEPTPPGGQPAVPAPTPATDAAPRRTDGADASVSGRMAAATDVPAIEATAEPGRVAEPTASQAPPSNQAQATNPDAPSIPGQRRPDRDQAQPVAPGVATVRAVGMATPVPPALDPAIAAGPAAPPTGRIPISAMAPPDYASPPQNRVTEPIPLPPDGRSRLARPAAPGHPTPGSGRPAPRRDGPPGTGPGRASVPIRPADGESEGLPPSRGRVPHQTRASRPRPKPVSGAGANKASRLSVGLAFVGSQVDRFGALPRKTRRRVTLSIASGLALGLLLLLVPLLAGGGDAPPTWVDVAGPANSAGAAITPSSSPSLSAAPMQTQLPPLLQAGPVSVDTAGWYAWALLDRTTGKVAGSKNMTSTNDTASMIKVWIAADYLRLHENPNQRDLADLSKMIRNSDNAVAEDMFDRLGRQASIDRLVDICQLHETTGYRGWWSNTNVSPRDAVLMGECIADGRGAGATWTDWLLDEMRNTVDLGRAGIKQALPDDVAETVAVKNGWIDRDASNEWHVNCLAIGDTWILAVENRYPMSLGVSRGFETCRLVTEQLMQH